MDGEFAPICGSCAHTESVATVAIAPASQCAICRASTTRRVESYIVERILGQRIAALHARAQ